MKPFVLLVSFFAVLTAACGQSATEQRPLFSSATPARSMPLTMPAFPLLAAPVGKSVASRPLLCLQPTPPVAYFCRIEHQLGRRIALPVKFRLGTVEYVDRLEYPGRWGVE